MNIILYVSLFCTFVVHCHVLGHYSNLLLTLLTVLTRTVDASTILGFHFFGAATIQFFFIFYLINFSKIRVHYSTASTVRVGTVLMCFNSFLRGNSCFINSCKNWA